jgi:hypothetical protein
MAVVDAPKTTGSRIIKIDLIEHELSQVRSMLSDPSITDVYIQTEQYDGIPEALVDVAPLTFPASWLPPSDDDGGAGTVSCRMSPPPCGGGTAAAVIINGGLITVEVPELVVDGRGRTYDDPQFDTDAPEPSAPPAGPSCGTRLRQGSEIDRRRLDAAFARIGHRSSPIFRERLADAYDGPTKAEALAARRRRTRLRRERRDRALLRVTSRVAGH